MLTAFIQNRRYWDTTISGAPIMPSRTSILETLPKVVASPPKISAKSSTGVIQRIFFGLRGAATGHPWVSLGMLIGIVIGTLIWGRGRVKSGKKRNSGGFFQLDGKEGFLNGGGYGKAD